MIQSTWSNDEPNVSRNRNKPRFKLVVQIQYRDIDNITEVVEIQVDWGGKSRTSLLKYPREILLNVTKRLYIGSSHTGGKISHNSVISGYTGIVKDGSLYRSQSCFHKKRWWYDWVYFQWQGLDKPLYGRIMMKIVISDCDIIHNMD